MANANGNDRELLTVGEFMRWAKPHDEALVRIEARQQEQGEAIAVLKDRSEVDRKTARNTGSIWGAAGGFVGGILTAIGQKILSGGN